MVGMLESRMSRLVQERFWYGCRPVSIAIRDGPQIGDGQ